MKQLRMWFGFDIQNKYKGEGFPRRLVDLGLSTSPDQHCDDLKENIHPE